MAKQFILVLCFTGIGTAYEMPVITGIRTAAAGDSLFVLINDLVSIWGIVLPLSRSARLLYSIGRLSRLCFVSIRIKFSNAELRQ